MGAGFTGSLIILNLIKPLKLPMNKGAIRFYNKLKRKNFTPKNICEVGVYLPQESNIIGFINDNVATTLVEADPNYVANIHQYFSGRKNIKVVEAAVFDFNGEVELSRRAASTFISQLKASPAIINDSYRVNDADKFIAKSILFSEVDRGDFDLISIDIEGAEWYVIKHMVSRPSIIAIETHGKYYTNPNIADIAGWMKGNNYEIWYKDASDTIFVKRGTFRIFFWEKVQLLAKNTGIALLKKKKLLKAFAKA
jgi:FkbM family methyltransferase